MVALSGPHTFMETHTAWHCRSLRLSVLPRLRRLQVGAKNEPRPSQIAGALPASVSLGLSAAGCELERAVLILRCSSPLGVKGLAMRSLGVFETGGPGASCASLGPEST